MTAHRMYALGYRVGVSLKMTYGHRYQLIQHIELDLAQQGTLSPLHKSVYLLAALNGWST